MWVCGQQVLDDLFLSEGILVCDLNHKLTELLNMGSFEELFRVILDFGQVCLLKGDEALANRSRVVIN